MNLKARLKNLETKTEPPHDGVCIFIHGEYPAGEIEPPVIGYWHDDDVYMRLDGESDDDLKTRVKSGALAKAALNDNGKVIACVHAINEGD